MSFRIFFNIIANEISHHSVFQYDFHTLNDRYCVDAKMKIKKEKRKIQKNSFCFRICADWFLATQSFSLTHTGFTLVHCGTYGQAYDVRKN